MISRISSTTPIAAAWVDSTGRRNTSSVEVSNGTTKGMGIGTDRQGADALAGAAAAKA